MKNLETKTPATINHFLNLKFHLIESLKLQGAKSNWIYPTLLNLNIHKIHFNK